MGLIKIQSRNGHDELAWGNTLLAVQPDATPAVLAEAEAVAKAAFEAHIQAGGVVHQQDSAAGTMTPVRDWGVASQAEELLAIVPMAGG